MKNDEIILFEAFAENIIKNEIEFIKLILPWKQLDFITELPQPVGLYPLNEDTLKDMISNKIEMKNADVTKGPGGETRDPFRTLLIRKLFDGYK